MKDFISPAERMDSIMGHLIMTRKVGESIMVDDSEIIIHETRGRLVRIGVIADKKVRVDRKEIRESKDKNAELAV